MDDRPNKANDYRTGRVELLKVCKRDFVHQTWRIFLKFYTNVKAFSRKLFVVPTGPTTRIFGMYMYIYMLRDSLKICCKSKGDDPLTFLG